MGKINKYIILIIYLFLNFEVVAQGGGPGTPGYVPPTPGEECCIEYEGDDPDNPPQAYIDCMANPAEYCNPILPVDNSIYIYGLMAAGFVLASFVMIKKIYKKTPI